MRGQFSSLQEELQEELLYRQFKRIEVKYLDACERRGLDPKSNKLYLYVDNKGWYRVGIQKPLIK